MPEPRMILAYEGRITVGLMAKMRELLDCDSSIVLGKGFVNSQHNILNGYPPENIGQGVAVFYRIGARLYYVGKIVKEDLQ